MRCYICDYTEGSAQSAYNSTLIQSKKAKKNRVKLADDNRWICDFCEDSANSSNRSLKRLTEPDNPDLYRHDVTLLLKEFKEDLPNLYKLLDVDGIEFDPSISHELMLDSFNN